MSPPCQCARFSVTVQSRWRPVISTCFPCVRNWCTYIANFSKWCSVGEVSFVMFCSKDSLRSMPKCSTEMAPKSFTAWLRETQNLFFWGQAFLRQDRIRPNYLYLSRLYWPSPPRNISKHRGPTNVICTSFSGDSLLWRADFGDTWNLADISLFSPSLSITGIPAFDRVFPVLTLDRKRRPSGIDELEIDDELHWSEVCWKQSWRMRRIEERFRHWCKLDSKLWVSMLK